MVSAYGPLVIHVLDPLITYSSPSRRAEVVMPPRASDPEFGSVMAQAPTFSAVRRSRPHRSIWAGVPLFMMVPAASPTLTPMEVTMPGQWWHSSMIGVSVMAAAPPSCLLYTSDAADE